MPPSARPSQPAHDPPTGSLPPDARDVRRAPPAWRMPLARHHSAGPRAQSNAWPCYSVRNPDAFGRLRSGFAFAAARCEPPFLSSVPLCHGHSASLGPSQIQPNTGTRRIHPARAFENFNGVLLIRGASTPRPLPGTSGKARRVRQATGVS